MNAVIAVCLYLASQTFELPPQILPTILAVEGGKVGTVSKNTNATVDLGPMQVNSIWLEEMSKTLAMPPQAVRHRLTHDACFNVFVAAYILRGEIDAAGGKFWDGVGHYHSRTPAIKARYLKKITRTWARLFNDPPGGAAR